MEICLQCGDKGTTNAFVYCVNCLDCVLHRYCMEVVTFDEYVHWVCDDCEAILQKQSAPQNCDAVTCNKEDRTVSEDIEVLSGDELKKCATLTFETERNACEGDPTPKSSETCTKIGLAESVTCNKEDRTVSEDIEVLSGEELKKCATLAFETERNACEGDPTPKSSETCTKIGLAECDKSASGSTCPIVEKDQNGSGKQRDQKRRSQQSCESVSEPGMGEHTSLEHKTSFKNSKKMKNAVFCEANSEEHGRNSIYADPNTNNSHEEAPKDLPNVSSVLGCHEPALPVITPIWRGSFNIWNKDNGMLDEFVAHMSSKACQKVFDEANQFQGVLHMEMLPKSRMWPKSFETSQPNDDSIALYFFPSDTRYERIFDHLVEEMMSQELAMKAILSNAELLVFTSLELPSQCWRFQGKYYLWGVFRGKQVPSHIVDNHLTDSIGGDKTVLYSDCSKHMDVSGGKNTMKTKNRNARSPLSPLSDND